MSIGINRISELGGSLTPCDTPFLLWIHCISIGSPANGVFVLNVISLSIAAMEEAISVKVEWNRVNV